MRVLQLIDSLDAGGAERVAVTLANALSDKIKTSYLCATRKEGALKESLNNQVEYLFLERTKSVDLRALFKLRKFIKKNNISIIHAHTTSYFIASLLKITYPKIKIIWHEHHGHRVNTTRNQNLVLYLFSFLFDKILTVNEELKLWCKNKLATKHVEFLPNFIDVNEFSKSDNKRTNTIVCLANLRNPKNHLNLLKAFKDVHSRYPNWYLQLIGKDFKDSYSKNIKTYISKNNLENSVEIVGSTSQVFILLSKARIGVLSSDYEGLPIALLEYGASRLAVVATDVGYCKKVLKTYGKTVPFNDFSKLSEGLLHYIENKNERNKDANNLRCHINKYYSKNSVLPIILKCYKDLL